MSPSPSITVESTQVARDLSLPGADAPRAALSRVGAYMRALRTIRHLKMSQLYWRVRYMLRRRRPVRVPDVPAKFTIRTDLPNDAHGHHSDDYMESFVDEMARGELTLVGQTRKIGLSQPDWRLGSQTQDRLWTVTLHYHEWALRLADAVTDESLAQTVRDKASELLRHYLTNWVDHCALTCEGSRDLAWNAYAIATRLGHWAQLHQRLAVANWSWGDLRARWLASMWRQAAYLHENLEWDLRGNHLLRDAVGLAWAGRFFGGPEPARWLATATQLAVSQAREQVLSDGGHFERSPMYHLHAMEDFLTLSKLVEDHETVAILRKTYSDMSECARWLSHPDGNISLFNDAAMMSPAVCRDESPQRPASAIQADRQSLLSSTGSPNGRLFEAWGLAIWHGEPWSVFFDVAPVGPDFQPGHAHADTLSIECSYRGHRLFVDPGTFSYDMNANRIHDRSTATHNTVCIDGQDSSEVWHIFRVGRRAWPRILQAEISPAGMRVVASHNGYRYLPGRPVHMRTVEVDDTGPLRICDRVEGGGEHQICGSLLLATGWCVIKQDDTGWTIARGIDHLKVTVATKSAKHLDHVDALYHPGFGIEEHVTRLRWQYQGELPVEVYTTVGPLSV